MFITRPRYRLGTIQYERNPARRMRSTRASSIRRHMASEYASTPARSLGRTRCVGTPAALPMSMPRMFGREAMTTATSAASLPARIWSRMFSSVRPPPESKTPRRSNLATRKPFRKRSKL
jgi:hypothetical protein